MITQAKMIDPNDRRSGHILIPNVSLRSIIKSHLIQLSASCNINLNVNSAWYESNWIEPSHINLDVLSCPPQTVAFRPVLSVLSEAS